MKQAAQTPQTYEFSREEIRQAVSWAMTHAFFSLEGGEEDLVRMEGLPSSDQWFLHVGLPLAYLWAWDEREARAEWGMAREVALMAAVMDYIETLLTLQGLDLEQTLAEVATYEPLFGGSEREPLPGLAS